MVSWWTGCLFGPFGLSPPRTRRVEINTEAKSNLQFGREPRSCELGVSYIKVTVDRNEGVRIFSRLFSFKE